MSVRKYRKKPVEVEAVQWTRNDAPIKLIDFTNSLVQINDVEEVFKVYDRLHNEWIPFYWDDWIIKGVQGEFYPCRADVFAATYEETEETKVVREGQSEEWQQWGMNNE